MEIILGQISGCKLRLDFNSGMGTVVNDFFTQCPRDWDSHIEYVEDPCPYEQKTWELLRKRVAIASDEGTEKLLSLENPPFDVLIHKPARQSTDVLEWARLKKVPVTITSSMDHPVGIAHALLTYQNCRAQGTLNLLEAGCLTHQVYQADDFTKRLFAKGKWLNVPEGRGIGFDDLLEGTEWTPL